MRQTRGTSRHRSGSVSPYSANSSESSTLNVSRCATPSPRSQLYSYKNPTLFTRIHRHQDTWSTIIALTQDFHHFCCPRGKSLSSRRDQFTSPCFCPCPPTISPCPFPRTLNLWQRRRFSVFLTQTISFVLWFLNQKLKQRRSAVTEMGITENAVIVMNFDVGC